MKDGRRFSGLTRAEDSFSLDLEQKDGKLVMLDTKDIASKTETGSTTPANTLSARKEGRLGGERKRKMRHRSTMSWPTWRRTRCATSPRPSSADPAGPVLFAPGQRGGGTAELDQLLGRL